MKKIEVNDLVRADENGERVIDVEKLDELVESLELDLNGWLKKLPNRVLRLNLDKSEKFLDVEAGTQPSGNNDDENRYFNCPFNRQHTRILVKNYEKHVNICKLKQNNYSKIEIKDYYKQPNVESPFQIILDSKTQSSIFEKLVTSDRPSSTNSDLLPIPFDPAQFHKNTTTQLYRDTAKKATKTERQVALTSNHLFTDYSTSERLALYDYSVEQSKKLGFFDNKSTMDNVALGGVADDREEQDEAVTAEANKDSSSIVNKPAKVDLVKNRRRPRSYQTSSAKSHTQVMRELIQTQMEYLTDDGKYGGSEGAACKRERDRSSSLEMSNQNRKRHK